MDRVLFTIKPHSIIDVITNSSSELFVGKSQNKEELISLLKAVYPGYLNEYNELMHIDELSMDQLETYISYHCSSHCWPASKSNYGILNGFTFEELYEPEKDWQTGKVKSPAWNGELQYQLRDNAKDEDNKWNQSFVTESNVEEIKNKLDPNREMYFLFSNDENPNWEMQEKLMNIMNRYHLG